MNQRPPETALEMHESRTAPVEDSTLTNVKKPRPIHRGIRGLTVAVIGLAVLFSSPLLELGRFALSSPVYSYILLIPLVAGYIAWSNVAPWPRLGPPTRIMATLFIAVGIAALAIVTAMRLNGSPLQPEDRLAVTTTAFVLTLAGTCGWFLGKDGWKRLRFPLAFLVFLIPLPTAVMHAIETFMQHGSALVANGLFVSAGNTVFYENLHFQLPGITLHVAPECSGIRSTLVLFIVSVLTGHVFLHSTAGRVLLCVAVLPLALLRNGFRIFTIGELCTYMGPHMIESPIHRQGGPVFFALSLVPFFCLLFVLAGWERKRSPVRHS